MKSVVLIIGSVCLFSVTAALSTTATDSEDVAEVDDSSSVKGSPEAKSGYESQEYEYERQRPQVFFGGQYGGRCDQDGFYYNDDNSFITCNHGIAYVQQCAPGTRNGAAGSYRAGGYYTHTAFCDINLVDFGYAAYHSQRSGYGHSNRGYGQSTRGYGHSSGGYGQSNRRYSQSSGVTGYGHKTQHRGYNSGHNSAASSGYGSRSSGGYASTPSSGYRQASPHGNKYQTQQSYSYKQPTYQVYRYRPATQTYKPSRKQTYGGYQKPSQGHSAYGRKYSGYYTQRRYH